MKLLLFTLLALALGAPLSWAARKKPENPIKDWSPPSSAQRMPSHRGKHRKQLTASELNPGKGVAEETLKSAAAVERVAGGKEAHQQEGKPSIQKANVLRRKAATHLDGQKLWKGDGAKKEMTKAEKRVLGPRKINTNSTTAKPESTDPGSDVSLAKAGGWLTAKKLLVKEHGAPHRVQTRKGHATAQRNVTGEKPSPLHRNESQELSSPVPRNASRMKEGKEHRSLHRNISRAQLQKEKRKSSWVSGKEDGALYRNASRPPTGKEQSTLPRNGSRVQQGTETRFLHKNSSQAASGKQHGILSTNSTWTLPRQKPGLLQRSSGQTHVDKRPSFTLRNSSQQLPGKRHGMAHGNTSRGEARKEPSPSQKNASQSLKEEKSLLSLRNVSLLVIEQKPKVPHRNASWAVPRKRQGPRYRNASGTEFNRGHGPSHRNSSWVLPRRDSSSSHRNISQALTGTKRGNLQRSGSQSGVGNTVTVPLRNSPQRKTVKEQSSSHQDHFQARADTPKWRPPVPKERDETIMPSLPTTCLLSEHAIACGNAGLKSVPKLSDSVLKTLYLAENEITYVPAGIFLGLPNLEWLDLSKNKLVSSGLHSETFKNLTKLKRLNLDGNRLTTIPALPSSLQELKMNDNNLDGLQRNNVRGLFKLLTLELEGNQLHDGNVLPTAFKPLSRLVYLRLDRNRFRAIPSGLPASLQELHLDSNRIEEVTEGVLNKTLNLTVLILSNNQLQEDRIAPRAWIDLPKLEALDLSHNRLAHVPSFLPRHLKQLTLHHNCIERIPGYVFAHMKPGLEFLHLSHNLLRDDGIHAVSFLGLYRSLAELLLDNNQLQAVPRGILNLKGLQVLRLSHNRIRHVPLNSVCDTRVAEDSGIVSLHLENNLIDRRHIPPTAFSCIRAYHSVVLRPQQNEEDY
ncbi:extracellular matrix protein 2-like [Eublepharis macularius]|uniref:Extracellular matrix protein 2-like n=1 Tax=Eublepharis macularius TaxID=481883 RepID=A0AA97KNM0_EUBMA|nr:extracellular matrix protein 2-like [Eublepharis macularius]